MERPPLSVDKIGVVSKVRSILPGLSYAQSIRNAVWLAPLDPDDIVEMFEQLLLAEELYEEVIGAWNASEGKDFADRTLEYFTNFYFQDDILMKADRASMMNALETRAIFLDNNLVDFCQCLPHRFKRRRGQSKYLVRRGMLPDDVLAGRKMGFGIPLADWLKTIPAPSLIAPVPAFRMALAAERWQEHRSGSADRGLFMWSWLALQMHIDHSALAAAHAEPVAPEFGLKPSRS